MFKRSYIREGGRATQDGDDLERGKLIFVCSPFGNDQRNASLTKLICLYVFSRDCVPFAAHLHYPAILDDGTFKERELGIRSGIEILSRCDEMWVFTNVNDDKLISEGMRREIEWAERFNTPISYFEHDNGSRIKAR